MNEFLLFCITGKRKRKTKKKLDKNDRKKEKKKKNKVSGTQEEIHLDMTDRG